MRPEPVPEPERARTVLLTAAVLVAIAAVWAIGLGIVDGLQFQPGAAAPTAPLASRAVRRPVLFVIYPHRVGEPEGAIAIPIASIELDGTFEPPLLQQGSEEARRADEGAFIATYCRQGAALRLLLGGAFAGTLAYGTPASLGSGVPVVRLVSDSTGAGELVELSPESLLGISDPRFGAVTSGARPMQAVHRQAVEQLTRIALKERYPQWQLESADLARVRVADLDRVGEPEVLASRTLHLRGEGGTELTVALFIIGESEAGAPESFRLVYVAAAESAPRGDPVSFAFVDQANLTPTPDDEIVVRSDRGGLTSYLILQRTGGRWREAFASRPVTWP